MSNWVCFLCLPFSRSGLLQRRRKWRGQLKAFYDRESVRSPRRGRTRRQQALAYGLPSVPAAERRRADGHHSCRLGSEHSLLASSPIAASTRWWLWVNWHGSFVASKPRNEALVAVGEGPGEGGWQVLSTSQSPVLRSKRLGLCWPGVGPFGSPAEKPGGAWQEPQTKAEKMELCPSERYTEVPSPIPVNVILLGKSVLQMLRVAR